MSVLIKDMEMPDNCEECRFDTECGFCSAMPDNFCGDTDGFTKPDWCPLVEVPTPHGRLIDADALKNYIENDGHTEAFAMAHIGREGKFFLMGNITADIDGQKTVIEAEEGKDE